MCIKENILNNALRAAYKAILFYVTACIYLFIYLFIGALYIRIRQRQYSKTLQKHAFSFILKISLPQT